MGKSLCTKLASRNNFLETSWAKQKGNCDLRDCDVTHVTLIGGGFYCATQIIGIWSFYTLETYTYLS